MTELSLSKQHRSLSPMHSIRVAAVGAAVWAVLGTVASAANAAPIAASCQKATTCVDTVTRWARGTKRTTCGDPIWELRYSFFYTIHRAMFSDRVKALDARLNQANTTHQKWEERVGLVEDIGSIVDAVGIETTKEALVAYVTTGLGVYEGKNEIVTALVKELGDAIGPATTAMTDPKELAKHVIVKSAKIAVNGVAAWAIGSINDEYIDLLDADSILQEYYRTCGSTPSVAKISGKGRSVRFNEIAQKSIRSIEVATRPIIDGCAKTCRQICTPNSVANASCSVANGNGTLTNTCSSDGLKWVNGACKATQCTSGYALRGDTCVKTLCAPNATASQSCSVANGTGKTSNTCSSDGSKWVNGACKATQCGSGYALRGDSCVKALCAPNTTASQSCSVANGAGTATNTCSSDGSRWVNGACKATTCNAGFKLSQNSCTKR